MSAKKLGQPKSKGKAPSKSQKSKLSPPRANRSNQNRTDEDQKELAVKSSAPAKASAVDDLFSTQVTRKKGDARKNKKKEKAVEKLPKELREMGDILVAGRKLEREISLKLRFAEKKVKDFCLKRFAEEYAEHGHRPESATYETGNAVFTFTQTRRITLTPEKVEALGMRHINLSGETELHGIQINFEAIRRYKLETKLKEALEKMNVSKEILQECFHPEVHLKESFFEHLSAVVSKSLENDEKLGDKMYEALQILDPANQIRNAELPNMNAVQAYKLIHDSDVIEVDPIEALDD